MELLGIWIVEAPTVEIGLLLGRADAIELRIDACGALDVCDSLLLPAHPKCDRNRCGKREHERDHDRECLLHRLPLSFHASARAETRPPAMRRDAIKRATIRQTSYARGHGIG